ncbi:MAG: hypothetical protein ACRYGK_03220, partial [Janthinobacterium lividum]
LAGAPLAQGNNRTLLTEYNNNGQVSTVVQPQGWTYDSNAAAGQQYAVASKTTQHTYNAFGDLVRVNELVNAVANTWRSTNHYVDLNGNAIASVDALGYLTTQTFDATGNITSKTEFATAIAGWNGLSAPASPPSAVQSANDRRMDYRYDLNNRKTSENQHQVIYSDASNGTTAAPANPGTTFGYDAVGNLTRTTDATGAATYTYYDALGRVFAVAAPARQSTIDGAPVIPLTVFYRDAYGNVVLQTEFANGTTSATESAFGLLSGSSSDRSTVSQYDRFGHVTQ